MKPSLQAILEQIYQQLKPRIGEGKVADYIPELAKVEPHQFGMAICDLDGNLASVGDAQVHFSIQSISKLFTLAMAMQIYSDELWLRVGREPSGERFNSLTQLDAEQGIPRNPFINAGALLICDMVESRCSAPNFQLVKLLEQLSGNSKLIVDYKIAHSELETGSRNAAMAYLMKSYGNFNNRVDKVLESYVHHCAIKMSCVDLAKATVFLANRGVSLSGTTILSSQQTKQMNALLSTCGLYDAAGDFAYRVGLPGKSGVGGGIVAIYPGQYAICVWSPGLNAVGNSLLGTDAMELLSEALEISIY